MLIKHLENKNVSGCNLLYLLHKYISSTMCIAILWWNKIFAVFMKWKLTYNSFYLVEIYEEYGMGNFSPTVDF